MINDFDYVSIASHVAQKSEITVALISVNKENTGEEISRSGTFFVYL